MSSQINRSKLVSCCAIALSGLIVYTSLPVLAQSDQQDLENWIEETGSQKATQHKSVNEVLESQHSARAQEGQQQAQYDVPDPPSALVPSGKKIAQVIPGMPKPQAPALPAHVSAALNAASGAASPAPTMLKGGVSFCIPRGTPLKLKLATIPMPEFKQDIRDEEGNLRPAQLGEPITAKITEDIYVDDNKVIPEGTIFHGKVSKIIPPKHVGRPGHLELQFARLDTPDGRSFSFKAEANNFKPSTPQSKLRGAGRLAAHAGGGAALGALVAYKLSGGLQNTIAMHGYNVAGGAALGATAGLAYALWKRGPNAVLEPGDEFNMSIDTDMLIPAAVKPTVKPPAVTLPGFEMAVIKKKISKDDLGFGGSKIRVEAMIVNHSHRKLSSIDLFLENEHGERFAISPDAEEESQQLFYIQPISQQYIVCTFAVPFPKLKHKLVWIDHITHDVLFEQKVK